MGFCSHSDGFPEITTEMPAAASVRVFTSVSEGCSFDQKVGSVDSETSPILSQDLLAWHRVGAAPPPECELIVETAAGFLVIEPPDPWPYGAWRWAKLPERIARFISPGQHRYEVMDPSGELELLPTADEEIDRR